MAKRNKHYLLIEDQIRRELDSQASCPSSALPEMLPAIDGIPAYVEQLRRSYESDRNPVHAWHAIVQLYHYAIMKNMPLALPTWVLAYLVRGATGIIGTAVNRPELQQAGPETGKRPTGQSLPPVRNPTGGNDHFSDWFAGSKPAERVRIANEALSFLEGPGGANPFLRAHRQLEDEKLLRRAAELKSEGMTDEQIVNHLDHPRLAQVGNRVRWLRRARAKWSQ